MAGPSDPLRAPSSAVRRIRRSPRAPPPDAMYTLYREEDGVLRFLRRCELSSVKLTADGIHGQPHETQQPFYVVEAEGKHLSHGSDDFGPIARLLWLAVDGVKRAVRSPRGLHGVVHILHLWEEHHFKMSDSSWWVVQVNSSAHSDRQQAPKGQLPPFGSRGCTIS